MHRESLVSCFRNIPVKKGGVIQPVEKISLSGKLSVSYRVSSWGRDSGSGFKWTCFNVFVRNVAVRYHF